jgi:hypothetical protein
VMGNSLKKEGVSPSPHVRSLDGSAHKASTPGVGGEGQTNNATNTTGTTPAEVRKVSLKGSKIDEKGGSSSDYKLGAGQLNKFGSDRGGSNSKRAASQKLSLNRQSSMYLWKEDHRSVDTLGERIDLWINDAENSGHVSLSLEDVQYLLKEVEKLVHTQDDLQVCTQPTYFIGALNM